MAAVLPDEVSSRVSTGRTEWDALDPRRQSDRVLVQLAVELVDEVEFPLQALDLPAPEAKGEDGHQPDEQEEGTSAQPVASGLGEGDGGGKSEGLRGGWRKLQGCRVSVSSCTEEPYGGAPAIWAPIATAQARGR